MTILRHGINLLCVVLMVILIGLGYPMLGIIVFLFSYGVTMGKDGSNKASKKSYKDVDTMEGIEFEYYVADVFRGLGYKCRVTQAEGDYGADVLATKGPDKIAIQCKRYKGSVGVESVYQILGGQKYYGCNKAMVVTNSYFTEQAKNLARKAEVILVDGAELKKLVKRCG